MIHRLQPDELEAVRPLFREPHMEFVLAAVVAGDSRGQVWADDPTHPQTACLWDEGPRYYFAGREDNDKFNAALAKEASRGAESAYLVAYCTSEAWVNKLRGIFAGRQFAPRQRCLYILDRLAIPDWRDRIPSGFSISRISPDILASERLENLDGLMDEIGWMWPCLDAFFEKAFGFCALRGETEIACWCTAELVSDGQLGVGIETVPQYQRMGLATFTASAFAEHCLANGIRAHWECWADNAPSVRVAEKAGFVKVLDYNVYQGQ